MLDMHIYSICYLFVVGSVNEANQSERERQIQIERRRRAAAFIGMLKQNNVNEESSSRYVATVTIKALFSPRLY